MLKYLQTANNVATIRAEKQRRVMELRAKGYTFEQIAQAVGHSRSYVVKMVTKCLEEHVREPTEQVILGEVNKLNALEQRLHSALDEAEALGDSKAFVNVADRIIKLMDRRAKLQGLDAATQDVANGKSGVEQSIVIYLPSNGR